MQIGTTGANEDWHNALKTALSLRIYSFAGVIQTFEDCARVIDNRAAKQLNPHSHVKARDIRNQKAKLREEELSCRL
jgi:hypothetical protein